MTKNNNSGFTLIEVMIALVILLIGILSLYGMQITSIKGNSAANQVTTASTLALDQIEQILSWADDDARLLSGDPFVPDGYENYTISWTGGTEKYDPGNLAQKIGRFDMEIQVEWETPSGDVKNVKMYITKPYKFT